MLLGILSSAQQLQKALRRFWFSFLPLFLRKPQSYLLSPDPFSPQKALNVARGPLSAKASSSVKDMQDVKLLYSISSPRLCICASAFVLRASETSLFTRALPVPTESSQGLTLSHAMGPKLIHTARGLLPSSCLGLGIPPLPWT